MGIKLTVLLFNKRGPFHWSCQHLAAIATDIETGKTFDINHSKVISLTEPPRPINTFSVYNDQKSNPLHPFSQDSCYIHTTTLFSNKNFDEFVSLIQEKFYYSYKFNFFSKNCSDAVNFAINELCPEKTATEVLCCIYKMLLFPLCLGSLGLSCFPAPPGCCNTPQDVYDKARWLANFTRYGVDQALHERERQISSAYSRF